MRAASRVATYARELIRLSMMQSLARTVSEMQGTESIVPPLMGPAIPTFESQAVSRSGKSVLLSSPRPTR